MIKKATIVLFFVMLGSACKKNYTCECQNANGTYVAGDVDATKSKAEKHCKSLSGSSSTTNCYVK